MPKSVFTLILLSGVITEKSFGQTTPIQLDRPDQTECPFIVPKNYVQVENGFTYESINEDLKTISYPSSLWKFGLNEKVEFRLITEVVSEKESSKTTTGLIPITLGFKANICQEKGIIPITSFIGHITSSNTGSNYFKTKYIAPSFRFLMQHTLSDKVSLAYNLGAEWNGETAEQTYIYTLTTGIAFTQKLGGYLEVYGFLPQDSTANHRFDCGFTYLVNNDFIVDLSGGVRITKNAPKNYLSLGLSYRFSTKKK